MDKKRKIKKIAIVSRSVAGVTGVTTTILEHTRRLTQSGWDVHVFGDSVAAGRIAAAGGQTHVLPRWPIGSYFKRRLFAWLFEREIRGESFDLIRGHGDSLKQDILCLHNCVHAAHEAVYRKPLPRSSGVGRIHSRILHEQKFQHLVANSKLTQQEAFQRFAVPKEKITVIYPGYDPIRFKPEDRELGVSVRRDLRVASDQLLIGLITSGDFRKRGVGIFLGALRQLPEKIRGKIRVLIVGRESRLGPYRDLAEQTGFGERIRFLPPEPNVEKFYHALDLYVHPAVYEEFGQSVQEAMACAVPVITTRRVGASELFGPAQPGILEGPPEESSLAQAMIQLVENTDMRRANAEKGRIVCQGNTWDKNFQKHSALYEKLLPELRSAL